MVHHAAFLVPIIETRSVGAAGSGGICGGIRAERLHSIRVVHISIVLVQVLVLGLGQGLGSGNGQRAEIRIRAGWILARRNHSRRPSRVED